MSEHFNHFTNPPLVEAVLGVSFAPVPGWELPHFGLYWAKIKADYPRTSVQPPLSDEKPGGGELADLARLARCWFTTEDEVGLIQLQHDMFIRNWRKRAGEYPHFDATGGLFRREWLGFLGFLKENKMPAPEVRGCEVSYVNQVPEDQAGPEEVFRFWSGHEGRGRPATAVAVYEGIEGVPRTTAQATRAVLRHNGQKVWQLTIIAKAVPVSSSMDDIGRCLQKGRAAANAVFVDATSEGLRARWGQEK